jgi:demethylmenaquinone methyltransferase/2-methoxy-6-polyprenyl-1,4-benzoquinol methylase
MSTYVWMRVLESASRRYDLGIRLLSFGHIEKVYNRVAQLARGPEVLDLGCGTGNVALRLARRGLRVTGVDLSPEMLDLARRKTPPGVALRWVQTSAVELIDHFQGERFDTITSVLLFSELSRAEQREALRQCHRLLRPGGQLIVADEVRAPTLARRALHNLVRLPFAVITYALTQVSTNPVRDLEAKVVEAQFVAVKQESNRLGDFVLLQAEKPEVPNAAAA